MPPARFEPLFKTRFTPSCLCPYRSVISRRIVFAFPRTEPLLPGFRSAKRLESALVIFRTEVSCPESCSARSPAAACFIPGDAWPGAPLPSVCFLSMVRKQFCCIPLCPMYHACENLAPPLYIWYVRVCVPIIYGQVGIRKPPPASFLVGRERLAAGLWGGMGVVCGMEVKSATTSSWASRVPCCTLRA